MRSKGAQEVARAGTAHPAPIWLRPYNNCEDPKKDNVDGLKQTLTMLVYYSQILFQNKLLKF